MITCPLTECWVDNSGATDSDYSVRQLWDILYTPSISKNDIMILSCLLQTFVIDFLLITIIIRQISM